ncbi:MAG: PP2C family protein-serine/threonine phosphatase [Acidimicrobiales bacterium]
MSTPGHSVTAAVLADLVGEARLTDPSALGDLVAAQAARVGIVDPGLWLVDVQQRVLVPYGAIGPPGEEAMSVDGTLAGRAYRDGTACHAETDDGVTLWVPLLDGSDRLGVLGGRATQWTSALADDLSLLAAATATLIAAHRSSSDVVVRTRRLQAASLPVEVQAGLLPPLSFSTGRATVCGVLEPAYDIGGDSFDYALNDGVAHLAVFDAMGHGLSATLMVTVAVGAYRHARRSDRSLEATYDAIDTALSNQFGPDRFVTGMLAQLDLDSGRLSYVLAGHHPGLVLRRGRVVRHLDAVSCLPFGLGAELGPIPVGHSKCGSAQEALEPGDRVLIYTDGVIEARDSTGAFFGLERLEELLVREDASGTPASETMRRLIHAVLEHQTDDLQDDATLLLVEWHP